RGFRGTVGVWEIHRLRRSGAVVPLDRRAGNDRPRCDHGREADLRRSRQAKTTDRLAGTGHRGCTDQGRWNQRAGRLAEGIAGSVDQLADRAGGEVHRTADLLMTSALELALDDRRALRCGEILDRDHQRGDLLPPGEGLGRLLDAVVALVELLVVTD